MGRRPLMVMEMSCEYYARNPAGIGDSSGWPSAIILDSISF